MPNKDKPKENPRTTVNIHKMAQVEDSIMGLLSGGRVTSYCPKCEEEVIVFPKRLMKTIEAIFILFSVQTSFISALAKIQESAGDSIVILEKKGEEAKNNATQRSFV